MAPKSKPFKLTKKAIGYINKMIDYVLAYPAEYNQSIYPGVCNTQYCAAGHIVAAKSQKLFNDLNSNPDTEWFGEASKVIGLDTSKEKSRIIAKSLFVYAHNWPDKFYNQYHRAYNLKTEKGKRNAKARAFAARWRDFIEQYS